MVVTALRALQDQEEQCTYSVLKMEFKEGANTTGSSFGNQSGTW